MKFWISLLFSSLKKRMGGRELILEIAGIVERNFCQEVPSIITKSGDWELSLFFGKSFPGELPDGCRDIKDIIVKPRTIRIDDVKTYLFFIIWMKEERVSSQHPLFSGLTKLWLASNSQRDNHQKALEVFPSPEYRL